MAVYKETVYPTSVKHAGTSVNPGFSDIHATWYSQLEATYWGNMEIRFSNPFIHSVYNKKRPTEDGLYLFCETQEAYSEIYLDSKYWIENVPETIPLETVPTYQAQIDASSPGPKGYFFRPESLEIGQYNKIDLS